MIRIKRVYEPPARADGARVLVERLWPRGLTKAAAAVDLWLKQVAPSPGLRKWFAHDPAKWPEFQRRYAAELRANRDAVDALRRLAKAGPLTLVYAAKDEAHNSALLLQRFLERRAR